MYPKLEDCELINNEDYCKLTNPEFIGQTRVDKDRMYYMIWKDNNILYKTHHKI
jgi:hypothetical protein